LYLIVNQLFSDHELEILHISTKYLELTNGRMNNVLKSDMKKKICMLIQMIMGADSEVFIQAKVTTNDSHCIYRQH